MPALYLLAALVGGLASVNRHWTEPDDGIPIYLADNGVHVDLVLPARAAGLDWAPLVPKSDFRGADPKARWIAFGAGERRVYLDTPTWADLTPGTALHALGGGERVMHVEWVADPRYAARELRLRPVEYRRLWAAIRSELAQGRDGRPVKLDHPGYTPADRFYAGRGKTSAIDTCNQWVATQLRLAGVKAPLWSPFPTALTRRYREAG